MFAFPRARRVLVTAVAAVSATAALAAGPAAQAAPAAQSQTQSQTRRTTVLADCVHRAVRPHRVFVACGDGALFLQVRHYRFWHRAQAVGRGGVFADDCDPNCADGTFHRTPARIRFFRPVSTAHGTAFSRAAVRWHRADGTHGRDVYWLPTRAEG